MPKGITRSEILAKLPDLKINSFYYYCRLAGVCAIGTQQNKIRKHLTEYIFPLDSVEKLREVMK